MENSPTIPRPSFYDGENINYLTNSVGFAKYNNFNNNNNNMNHNMSILNNSSSNNNNNNAPLTNSKILKEMDVMNQVIKELGEKNLILNFFFAGIHFS